jgi:hypothetical protein
LVVPVIRILLDQLDPVGRALFGNKIYELDCTATIEFVQDCYWDWTTDFYTDPSPLADGFMVKDNHEIVEKPRPPQPPSTNGGLQPLFIERILIRLFERCWIKILSFSVNAFAQSRPDPRGSGDFPRSTVKIALSKSLFPPLSARPASGSYKSS